ncbi:MAG: ABC-F family ATP-binding cassette domain-containing protein [Deltaproteobacteria bacterium]|nr:ABC-F family ATP-binding cassette domain-containing protein [Deltaproteobacteria bacterium]MBW2414113.1 ABC-F family ATP-binding cassette domain-containing protein [Deltaproteobacteria bacterium]
MRGIQLEGVAVQHAGRTIFRDLDWRIGERDRVGLIGPNGSGKSSLLRVIAGESAADAGRVTRPRGLSIGYLAQEIELTPGRTLLEEARVLPPRLAEVQRELDGIEARLADSQVYGDERKLAHALARQEEALERFEQLGGGRHEGRVRELLARFGFGPEHADLPTGTLSGGQKKLIALARLALDSPDVLLLDEPDNHLDLEAKQGLEAFIRDYDGAVVIVSHDRYLLDDTVDSIAELDEGHLTVYPGNYSTYAAERELRRLRQRKTWSDQQKEIARIEASIQRFELWASMVVNERHIKQARSRRKMLDRMEASGELVDKVRESKRMGLRIEGGRGSRKALELSGVSMGFDGQTLFDGVELLVSHGERVGLIGPNGSGKSVLLRLVLGVLEPAAGRIRIGPSTRVGYYAQEHETLDAWLDRTLLDRVRDAAPMTQDAAVAFLLKFLFSYEQVRQPIGTLSGGERSRLQLACLVLEKPNLLLLDEPTNNLDIRSAEVLEEALDDFEGSVLAISHDRYFLDRAVDRVVALEDASLREYAGGYTDYLEAVRRA